MKDFIPFIINPEKINNIKINNWFARRTNKTKPNEHTTNTRDEQIMNDILIQLERMKQNQKFILAIDTSLMSK
jgi:hypothetical protein